MAEKTLYRIIFSNHGKVYEIYARSIAQSQMFGFIEVEQFVFGENSAVVVDPGEEKIKAEFDQVKRTYLPLQAIFRIDEVMHQGVSKVRDIGQGSGSGTDNVISPFPSSAYANLPDKPTKPK